jgi:uncharacterized phage protein (TIGR01671 family)
MERVIKFRAYNPKEKKMSGDFTLYEIASAGSKTIFPFGFIANKDTVLMQYTGLKDKNNKEIYEGDIVNININALENPDIVAEVVWCNADENRPVPKTTSGFYYRMTGDVGSMGGDEELVEVIGNIYENPNLLSEKEE